MCCLMSLNVVMTLNGGCGNGKMWGKEGGWKGVIMTSIYVIGNLVKRSAFGRPQ